MTSPKLDKTSSLDPLDVETRVEMINYSLNNYKLLKNIS